MSADILEVLGVVSKLGKGLWLSLLTALMTLMAAVQALSAVTGSSERSAGVGLDPGIGGELNLGCQHLQGGTEALPVVRHPVLPFLQVAFCLPFFICELMCHLPFFLPFFESGFVAFPPTVFIHLFLRFFPTFEFFISTYLLPLFQAKLVSLGLSCFPSIVHIEDPIPSCFMIPFVIPYLISLVMSPPKSVM